MKNIFSLFAVIIIITTTIQAQVPTNGLVAYYPFSGNANDSSGNVNSGTVNGATLTTDRFGKMNSAYSFDGTSNYINIANSNNFPTKYLSISIWFKSVYKGNINYSSNLGRYLYAKGADICTYRAVMNASPFSSPNNITQQVGYNNAYYTCSSSFNDSLDLWHHLIITFDGLVMKQYIDNVLSTSTSLNGPLQSNNGNLTIGCRLNNSILSDFFLGKLDDIRIYNRALDSTEVKALFNEGGFGVTTISSFLPKLASANTTVTIKGKSFTGTTAVSFGGIAASNYRVFNDSIITAVVGNGSSGDVQVVAPSGTASLKGFVFSSTSTNGLVAWYPFTANTLDSSGSGNNLVNNIANITYTQDRFGRSNASVYFSGIGEYLNKINPSLPSLDSDRTVSIWYNAINLNSENTSILNYGSFVNGNCFNQFGIAIAPVDSGYYFWSRCNDLFASTKSNSLNNWHHIVLTYLGSNGSNIVKIFKDNLLIKTAQLPNSLNTILNDLQIGSSNNQSWVTYNYKGSLDDIRIYNRVLDSIEVRALYNEGGYSTTLPLQLTTLFAAPKEKSVVINWASANETNTASFIVERSSNGSTFSQVGMVKANGSGNHSYSYTDASPVNGTTAYYRLKMIDKDGNYAYSKIISINILSVAGFTIIPNPAINNTTLHFNRLTTSATINVYNVAGKKVFTDNIMGVSTNNYLLQVGKLEAGTYIVNVITKDGDYNNRLVITK